jgi:hypothetical protein
VTRIFRSLVLAAALASATSSLVRAQERATLLANGIRAYEALELQRALDLLSRSIIRTGADSLTSEQRVRALDYLAATELISGSRPAAENRMTQMVLEFPQHRMDHLVFPPRVTELFAEVRRRTRAVQLGYPGEVRIGRTGGALRISMTPTTTHEILVTLRGDDEAGSGRELYSGIIADSMEIQWDGRDAAGSLVTPGEYVIEVTSHGTGTAQPRVVKIPVRATVNARDTVRHPAPPPPLPARVRSTGPAMRALWAGLAGGTAVMILPRIVAPGSQTVGGRAAVAFAVSVTGIVAFASEIGRLRPAPGEPAARDAWAQWQRQIAEIRQENARRANQVELVLRLGREER